MRTLCEQSFSFFGYWKLTVCLCPRERRRKSRKKWRLVGDWQINKLPEQRERRTEIGAADRLTAYIAVPCRGGGLFPPCMLTVSGISYLIHFFLGPGERTCLSRRWEERPRGPPETVNTWRPLRFISVWRGGGNYTGKCEVIAGCSRKWIDI